MQLTSGEYSRNTQQRRRERGQERIESKAVGRASFQALALGQSVYAPWTFYPVGFIKQHSTGTQHSLIPGGGVVSLGENKISQHQSSNQIMLLLSLCLTCVCIEWLPLCPDSQNKREPGSRARHDAMAPRGGVGLLPKGSALPSVGHCVNKWALQSHTF